MGDQIIMVQSGEAFKKLEDQCNTYRAEAGKYKGMYASAQEQIERKDKIISEQSFEILRLENIALRCLDDLQSYCAEFEQVFDTVDLPYESMAEYLIRAEYLAGKKHRDCAHYIERVKIKMNALPAF
jgi:hypothetical protein